VVWAAGVEVSPLAAALGRATGADVDRTGRVTVNEDLTLADRPEVLVIGDVVRVAAARGGTLDLPGLAPARPAPQRTHRHPLDRRLRDARARRAAHHLRAVAGPAGRRPRPLLHGGGPG
jgi:hypothetical protein